MKCLFMSFDKYIINPFLNLGISENFDESFILHKDIWSDDKIKDYESFKINKKLEKYNNNEFYSFEIKNFKIINNKIIFTSSIDLLKLLSYSIIFNNYLLYVTCLKTIDLYTIDKFKNDLNEHLNFEDIESYLNPSEMPFNNLLLKLFHKDIDQGILLNIHELPFENKFILDFKKNINLSQTYLNPFSKEFSFLNIESNENKYLIIYNNDFIKKNNLSKNFSSLDEKTKKEIRLKLIFTQKHKIKSFFSIAYIINERNKLLPIKNIIDINSYISKFNESMFKDEKNIRRC